MAASFPASTTLPPTTEVTPFTSMPPVSPSSWAKSAASPESLLPSFTSQAQYTTIMSVSNGATRYYEWPVTALPATTSTGSSSSGGSKTTTIVLSVVLPIVAIAGIVALTLLYLRKRTRSRRQAWRARYPSQWSWDAKYHDAEPDPTPLEPTTSRPAAEGSSAYAFAPSFSPSHSRFPSSDLTRTPQDHPSLPQAIHHGRERSM